MRKITELMSRAFREGVDKSMTNTVVKNEWCLTEMFLHWNCIAHYDRNAWTILIDNCGRFTNTTKERLNGILKEFWLWTIRQQRGKWLYDWEYFYKTKFLYLKH